jgi:cell division protein ZapA
MEPDQDIKLMIAERPYRMTVNREEEETIRKASDVLNKAIKDYSKSFEYKDMQDLFAMVALQYVANSIRLEDQNSYREKDLENKLSEIDAMLTSHFDKL